MNTKNIIKSGALFLALTIVSVQAQDIQKINEISDQIRTYGLLVNQIAGLVKNLSASFPAKIRDKVPLVTDVAQDGSRIMFRVADAMPEFAQFEARGQRVKQQLECLTGKQNDVMVCSLVGCKNKNACIAATLTTVQEQLLRPIFKSMLGVVVTKDDKPAIEPGVLLTIAQSKLIPEDKRKVLSVQLSDYIIKLNSALDFINLLSYVINPEIPTENLKLTDAQRKDMEAGTVDIPLEVEPEGDFGDFPEEE